MSNIERLAEYILQKEHSAQIIAIAEKCAEEPDGTAAVIIKSIIGGAKE